MRHKRFYQFQKNWKSYLLGTPDISCEESLRSIETVAEFWSGYERPAPETKGSIILQSRHRQPRLVGTGNWHTNAASGYLDSAV